MMEVDGTTAAFDSKKKKRAAKNRKKYWKKNCSIYDVEEYLNDQRLQTKAGGLVSERPDEKLFLLDSKTKNKHAKAKTATQKRREKIAKARCYQSLEPDPNTTAIAVRRSEPLKIGSKKDVRRKKGETLRLGRLKQIRADAQRMGVLEDRRARRSEKERECVEGVSTNHYYTLWKEPDTEPPTIEEEFIEHTKVKPIKPPDHYYFKPSRLSAIEVAHPGTSYNPTYEDHQDLLRSVHTEEERRVEAARKSSSRAFLKKLPREEIERNWMEEMSSGLFDPDTSTAPDTTTPVSVGSLSSTAVGPPAPKRRTKAARRRGLLEKKRVESLKKLKRLKLLANDVYKLKSIKGEITKGEELHVDKIRRRRSLRRGRLDDTRRFGPHKYIPPAPDFQLTSELKGSYRLLKPEGDLLRDRFKSFEKRNILRATRKAKKVVTKKKNRPKRVEKLEVREITL